MDFVPKFTTGIRVDTGRGLVEQEETRLVHEAGGERQTLFPAAGQRACQLPAAGIKPQILQRIAHRLADRIELVEPGNESQVLLDRKILVEGKTLGHIADLALDLEPVGQEVVAEHGPMAGIRFQKTAHDADRRGLARAVGTQKAGDLATSNHHGDMIDNGLAIEALGQVVDVNHVHLPAISRSTSTIWPGLSAGSPSSGRASTR